MRRKTSEQGRVWFLVLPLLAGMVWGVPAAFTQEVGNLACPGEEVFFDPGGGEDILVPPGYTVEVFAAGLNFPAGIAFRGAPDSFEVFVTEAGASLPGRCNDAAFFEAQTGVPAAENPFLSQVRVLDNHGTPLRALGRPPTVAQRADPAVLHSPTIGITFEREFQGGRLFASDSLQSARAANSSRIVELDPTTGALTALITGLPTGDHPTEQLTVRDGVIFWSQGSATNSGVVGHDNAIPEQHDIPCQDVVLSGNNFDSGDGHVTGGFLPHGV